MGDDRPLGERTPSRWPIVLLAVAVAASTLLAGRWLGGDDPQGPTPVDLPGAGPSAGDARWVTRVDGAGRSAPVVVGAVVVVAVGDGLVGLERDTGALLWRVRGLAEPGPPAAVGPHVVVGVGGTLVGVRAIDGVEAWRLELAAPAAGPAAVGGRRLVVASTDGSVTSIDGQRGAVRWRTRLGAPPAAAVALDRLVAAVPDERDRVHALRVESGARVHAATVRGVRRVAASGGRVVAVTADADVVVLDRDGHERWREPLDGPAVGPPAVIGDIVVVATAARTIHAYDIARGDLLWVRRAEASVRPPLLHRRDVVVAVTAGGSLHRLDAGSGRQSGSARVGPGSSVVLNPGSGPAAFGVDDGGLVTALRIG